MKTIRRFGNLAEANFFQSLLESAGIEANLAEELTFALGPGYAPQGIRLQVPDEDEERACKILDTEEEFIPLPEDFVPPTEPPLESTPPIGARFFIDFLAGGLCALFLASALTALFLALSAGNPHTLLHVRITAGGVAAVFFLGGLMGLIFPFVRQRLD
jgi:hypothetical protein